MTTEVKRHSVHLSNLSAKWKLVGFPKENLGEAAPPLETRKLQSEANSLSSCDLGLVD